MSYDCEICGRPHDNKFSLTCKECSRERESGDIPFSDSDVVRYRQAMADADMGGKIADMLFGKIPEKKE